MKEITITQLEAGQRFDKYLVKCLPNASKSFIYKMLRKKNITLNKKKADGSEKINTGDQICLFFSDETYEKFSGTDANGQKQAQQAVAKQKKLHPIEVIYEDSDVLFVNKPSGMLSQKADKNDISLVEYITSHLLMNGSLTEDDLRTFHPGICNRLDRNTSGIVAAGKTVKGLQEMTLAFKERTLHKYYICIVKGKVTSRQLIKGYLKKDEKTNKVKIYQEGTKSIPKDALAIETEYIPVCANDSVTLLKVNLITGRSHQIRAHLSSIGHPIAGDMKYGNDAVNQYFLNNYKIKDQMLHAFELDLPQKSLHLHTPIPTEFVNVLKGEKLWEPGIPEDLEGLH